MFGTAQVPWFVPDLSPPTYVNRLAVVPEGVSTWSSVAGVGDPNWDWTYLVMAVNTSAQVVAASNRVGEQDFAGDIP